MTDSVNSPAHYQHAGIETIEYISAVLGADGFEAYCVGNVLKYVSRYKQKGGLEDLRKAKVYLEWAIGEYAIEDQPDPMASLVEELLSFQDEEPALRAGEAE